MSFLRSGKRSLSLGIIVIVLWAVVGCDSGTPTNPTPLAPTAIPTAPPTNTTEPIPTATTVATPTPSPIPVSERKFVPIFCYHHIRDWEKSDSEDDRAYIVPPSDLEAQLKWLKEDGYHSVSSEQVYEYYANGRPLPDKPIMLTFDDNDDNQYTNALPLLTKYGFKATFFIMTVTIGQENYMNAVQLKELDREGHDIQPHTWDHHLVTQYETDEDWQLQIAGPKKELETLLGHPTPFFAYPFGIYNAQVVEKLKSYGYKAAFRLRDIEDPDADPVFAIKRYIANGYWDLDQFKLVTEGGWE
ncbi:MAG TPA: polysaccharide deacetylase family protein [Chloroflexia bacterium]|nr:polysaccharide deacetylase family protein [Chloroflexia bacterium]